MQCVHVHVHTKGFQNIAQSEFLISDILKSSGFMSFDLKLFFCYVLTILNIILENHLNLIKFKGENGRHKKLIISKNMHVFNSRAFL